MPSQKAYNSLNFWSRKIHIHIGLFLLLFVWLFSFSGLLLNHGGWKISSFWEERKQTEKVTTVYIANSSDSSAVLKNVMTQLAIAGEVSDVEMWQDSIHFRVSKPGEVNSLAVNFVTGLCLQKKMEYNAAGKIRTLHTFNGVDKNNSSHKPNWLITNVWRLSMDGIAIGLLLLCVSSWVMWYKIRLKYRWGCLALIAGLVAAGYFVFGVGLM